MAGRIHGKHTRIGNYLVGVSIATGDVTCKGKTIGQVFKSPTSHPRVRPWRSAWKGQLDWHKTRRDAIDAIIVKETTYYAKDYQD